MPHKHVDTSQTGFQGHSHHHHEHLKIHRLNEELPVDKSHYLLAAFGELHVGEPVPAKHIGPTVVYVIEGEIHVEDNLKPGEITKLSAGDVVHFEAGTANISTTPGPGKAKFIGVSYVPSNIHPDDLIIEKH